MSSNWKNWFLPSVRARELEETAELYAKAKAGLAGSPFADDEKVRVFITDLIVDICERRGVTPSLALGRALYEIIGDLLYLDGIAITFGKEPDVSRLTIEEGVAARSLLGRSIRFHADRERLLAIWREKLVWVFSGMLGSFPLSAFTDIDERGVAADDSIVLPEAKAYALCDDLPEVIERTIMTFFDDDVTNAHLFESLRKQLDDNAFSASGILRERRRETSAKLVLPSKQTGRSRDFLVDAYLRGTPLQSFFHAGLPLAIPFPARFEHTHVIGGTGHGKTQLLQFLINHDLVRAMEDHRSVVVIDSQGDLIKTISRLEYFDPDIGDLSDRFVLVDPNDVEHPVALNMFDFNRDRLSGYAPVDREKILNATIELYEYFFGALLGAELTQRQGLIFRYLARLLIEIPDATVHTLRELMEDGEKFRPYMEKLTGTARSFFATRFFDRQFNETKKQILTRLWGVLSNTSLERIFSHTKNKVDIFDLLNEGKIILINTAKDLLGQEGSAIFGRFFIALIAQAAIQRAALPPHKRRTAFVYIDEAQDYFDENISQLLTQARKYRVGLVFAHQNLDQLGTELRSSVLSSTSIKFAGGVSAKDANALDSELRCDADFLLAQKKGREHTQFACYVRNFTGGAISARIPLGYVDSLPKLSDADMARLLEENRARYSAPPIIPSDVPFASTPSRSASAQPAEPTQPTVSQPEVSSGTAPAVARPEPDPAQFKTRKRTSPLPREVAQPGRGGQRHKYLQGVIKGHAEKRGFRASIEEVILAGAGRVDVLLTRGERRIAVEISVTTTRDQELGNIEKCLAAGYAEIVLVGESERHVKSFAKFIEEQLEEPQRGKVRYFSPEELIAYLDSTLDLPAPTEKTVRDYRVKTVVQTGDPKEAAARRRAVAEVIARSLKRSSD